MPILNRMQELNAEITDWRQTLHQIPELGYEEEKTSEFIAARLEELGLEVQRGLAKTGLIATLKRGTSGKHIALRADIDALPIEEEVDVPFKSKHAGRMHACGHDGHTSMLLGAAKYLSEVDCFDGSVTFVFQPAEEGGAGGKAMVEQGLFERAPATEVYGMHNLPGLAVGEFAMRKGPIMGSADEFEITIDGQGGHAAMPHTTRDPVPVAAQIISSVQTLTSRRLSPLDSVVVSMTMLSTSAGSANIIPDRVKIQGTVRSLSNENRDKTYARMEKMIVGIANGMDCTARLTVREGYPVTINSEAETDYAARAAAAVAGSERVDLEAQPLLAAEDFSFMLNERPGSYIFIGNGAPGSKGSENLHAATYQFDDEALVFGSSYWVELVKQRLPKAA